MDPRPWTELSKLKIPHHRSICHTPPPPVGLQFWSPCWCKQIWLWCYVGPGSQGKTSTNPLCLASLHGCRITMDNTTTRTFDSQMGFGTIPPLYPWSPDQRGNRPCKLAMAHYYCPTAAQDCQVVYCMSMAEFDFYIEHRSGTKNVVPGVLSHFPVCRVPECCLISLPDQNIESFLLLALSADVPNYTLIQLK